MLTDTGAADVGVPRIAAVDVPPAAPHRPAQLGPWRHLPRVSLGAARILATWDEPPDLDGDDVPDALRTIVWDQRVIVCTATDDDHPCPILLSDDSGGNDRDGPLMVAFVTTLSGENSPDGGLTGRLLGIRRLWQAAGDMPSTRLAGFEFAEFGPGVLVRSTLQSHAAHGDDTLDVVDLFTGPGLARRAGALEQHCTRIAGATPARTGSIAVDYGSLTPLVWRAAQAHPFSGCETGVDAFDASLGGVLARGASVAVTLSTAAGSRGHVAIQASDHGLHVGEAVATPDGDGGASLAAGGIVVQEIVRACATDRVRYTLEGHHCEFAVARDDGAPPGCEDHASPLDPRPSRPVTLHTEADGSERLIFTRGGTALSVPMPMRCGRGGGARSDTTPWHGVLPPGLSISPDGNRVLAPNGFDLWLYVSGRRAPILLNPSGGALPRGTVRAAAFADADHGAAVIAEDFVRFDLTLTTDDDVPSELHVDPSEIARPFRGP